MKFSEKWGDSVESAVELALQDLGLTKEQVKVTVLEEPSRGFLGIIGNKLAKVRVEELAPEKPKQAPKAEQPAISAQADVKPAKAPVIEKQVSHEGDKEICIEVCGQDEQEPVREPKKNSKSRTSKNRSKNKPKPDRKAEEEALKAEAEYEENGLLSEKPDNLAEDNEHPVNGFLRDMFREMGLDVSVKVFSGPECVYVEVEGPDCGTVIGKRGQTLDSVQYLASLVVNKDQNKYIRVIIDAEGYRRKREITLEKLAARLAEKAIKSGRSVRLEPMNPYERKVIHSVLQNYSGVTTRSEGEEPYRRVIIEPVK